MLLHLCGQRRVLVSNLQPVIIERQFPLLIRFECKSAPERAETVHQKTRFVSDRPFSLSTVASHHIISDTNTVPSRHIMLDKIRLKGPIFKINSSFEE